MCKFAFIKYKDVLICSPRHFDDIMVNQLNNLKEELKVPTSYYSLGYIDENGDMYTYESIIPNKVPREND